jgi:autotransporter-associated beta strand protein
MRASKAAFKQPLMDTNRHQSGGQRSEGTGQSFVFICVSSWLSRSLLCSLCFLLLNLFAASLQAQEVLINGNAHPNNGHSWGKGGKPKPTPTPTPNLDPDYIPTSGTTSWNDSANWTPPTIPNATGAQAVFKQPTGDQIVTLDGSKTVGSLSLTNDEVGSSFYTFTLQAGTGGSLIFANSSGNNATLSVSGNGGTNEISANVTLNSSLDFSGGGSITINGAISGSGGINANGGTLKLGGNNSYSGGTTISSGLIWINNSNALASGSLTVNGGIVDLAGNNTTVGNLTGSGGTIWNNLGPTGSATLIIGSGDAGGGNYQGVIADANIGVVGHTLALTKTGTGTITLSGANTYSGGTTVSGGTLLINTNTVNPDDGSKSGTGSGAITVNSGGTLGGSGFINAGSNSVTINGTLMGGTGTSISDKLTVSGAVSMGSSSVIQLALGATSSAHSTLAIAGGSISFQTFQKFTFIDMGATAGTTYTGIVTGVGVDPITTGYTNTNGWTGVFTWDSANGGEINFNLIAIPEPETWIAAVLAAGALLLFVRRRRLQFS